MLVYISPNFPCGTKLSSHLLPLCSQKHGLHVTWALRFLGISEIYYGLIWKGSIFQQNIHDYHCRFGAAVNLDFKLQVLNFPFVHIVCTYRILHRTNYPEVLFCPLLLKSLIYNYSDYMKQSWFGVDESWKFHLVRWGSILGYAYKFLMEFLFSVFMFTIVWFQLYWITESIAVEVCPWK
jgi:hypothetical protein